MRTRVLLGLFFFVAFLAYVEKASAVYDPRTGRFMSRDPIDYNGGDENLYRYVKNDPINYVDPFGLQASVPAAAINAAANGWTAQEIATTFGISLEAAKELIYAALLAKAVDELIEKAKDARKPKCDDPCQDIRDAMNNPDLKTGGLEKRLAEHLKKLEDYLKNPWAYDNNGDLARNRNNPDQIKSIIEGRERNLENEIKNYEKQIQTRKDTMTELQKRYNDLGCGSSAADGIALFILLVTCAFRRWHHK